MRDYILIVTAVVFGAMFSVIGWALLTIYNTLVRGQERIWERLGELSEKIGIVTGRLIRLETQEVERQKREQ